MSTEKLTAKETLNLIIDREVVNIPFNIRNDFQRKLPDNGQYQIALKAMEEYAAQEIEDLKAERTKLRDWVKQLYLGNFGHQIAEIEQYLTNLPD